MRWAADRGIAHNDEQIPYLRRLWTGEPLTFHGEFDQIHEAAVFPGPEELVPIWVGGFSEVAFRRAARLGDGFVFGYGFGQAATEAWGRVKELLGEQDRPVEGFRSVFSLLPTHVGSHSLDDIAEALPRLREVGGTDVTEQGAAVQLSRP